MSRFILVSAMLLFAAVLASCGGETTAKKIYLEFRAKYEDKDYKGMLELLTEKTKTKLENLGGGDAVAGLQKKLETDKALQRAFSIKLEDLGKILENRMLKNEGSGYIGFRFPGEGTYKWNIVKQQNSDKWLINLP